MNMRLFLLGTGSPAPLLHRAGSGYVLDLDGQLLMIDCGPGTVRRLIELGYSAAQVSALFLTHLHYDHCVDYAYLVLNRWDQGSGKVPNLQVYGPPPVEQMTELLFGKTGAFAPDLAARTEHPGSEFIFEMRGGTLPRKRPAPVVREVTGGDAATGAGWALEVAEVDHCQPQITCLGFRLEAAGKTFVFSGDSAPTPKLTELARGADVLVHMCHMINGVVTDPRLTRCCSGHLDAARTARESDAKTLVLVHITEQLEQPGMKERILAEAAAEFQGNIIFGEDLMEVPVDGIGCLEIR